MKFLKKINCFLAKPFINQKKVDLINMNDVKTLAQYQLFLEKMPRSDFELKTYHTDLWDGWSEFIKKRS